MLVDFMDLVHQWKPPVGARRTLLPGRLSGGTATAVTTIDQ